MRDNSFLIVGLVLVVVFATGCTNLLSPQAKQQLQRGYENFEAGRDTEVIREMDAFLQANDRSSRADEAYYLRGMARLRTGNRAGAKEDFNIVLNRSNKDALRGKALVELGNIAYEDKDMALAENMYRQALASDGGNEPSANHARYRLGSVLQRQGRWKEADVQFDRLVHLLGDSDLGARAARRTHCTAWTIQAGAFRKKDLAELSAKNFKSEGLPASVYPLMYDSEPLFVVQLGRYPTYEQAEAALSSYKQVEGTAFIVPTP